MTKWKILNGIAFLLLWLVIIASYYSFLYPAPFGICSLVKQVEWESFSLLYIGLPLLAFTLSFVRFNQHCFQKNFLKILLVLHLAAIMSISILAGVALNHKRSEFKKFLSEIKQQAVRDIQAGSIRYMSYGLPHIDVNYTKRDSIMAKYGMRHTFNCLIDQFTEESNAYYKQLTKTYLDKRNGKDWERKMQNELALYP
ncbi:hypothetical protein ACLOAU_00440 [Niabella sp. CJ426]|uniref:FEKKY domain-containing protein n=1 Tax=Niabella sp. CJ426 TaxID=3393740 RepID=UPI003D046751